MTFAETDRPTPIAFGGVLVVVGGGVVDLALLARLHTEGAAVIAADGGAHTCSSAGIVPQAIIGDMDSLGSGDHWPADTQIIALDEQDTTDFEKCLYMTQAPVTLALGMTGARLDHTLASLDVIARYATGRHIVLVDQSDIALGLSGSFSFAAEPGQRISIHPLTPVHFARSEGLKYPLDDLILAPGMRTGTSNEANASLIKMTVTAEDSGVYMLILGRDRLSAMIAQLSAA